MGKVIDLARADAPLDAAVLDDFKVHLVIGLCRRLTDHGAKPLRIPVREVDDTGRFMLAFKVEDAGGPDPVFYFQLQRKS